MIPQGAPLDEEWGRQVEAFLDAVDEGTMTHAEQLPIARRIAWEYENQQQVPAGYWLRHACANRSCVNPAHAVLEDVRA